jgi:hypothetical protein
MAAPDGIAAFCASGAGVDHAMSAEVANPSGIIFLSMVGILFSPLLLFIS